MLSLYLRVSPPADGLSAWERTDTFDDTAEIVVSPGEPFLVCAAMPAAGSRGV